MRAEPMPLYQLDPAPDYEMCLSRLRWGWGEKVEGSGRAAGVLKKALDVVRKRERQALVNISAEAVSEEHAMRILATDRAAPPRTGGTPRRGHDVVIGRPLDMPGRRAYGEAELADAAARPTWCCAPTWRPSPPRSGSLAIVATRHRPLIGTDKIDIPPPRAGHPGRQYPTPRLRGGSRATVGVT